MLGDVGEVSKTVAFGIEVFGSSGLAASSCLAMKSFVFCLFLFFSVTTTTSQLLKGLHR